MGTHHQEECWNEVEEECVHEEDCSEPEPVYHSTSSSGGSRHKRSVSNIEEEAEDEELDTMLRSALDGISASEFLEMTSELSEEDLDEDDDDDDKLTTGVAVVDANSRAKRSVKHIKKALLGLKIGKKVGKKVAKVVKKSARKKKGDSCPTIKKCWDKNVRKCKSNPIETCEDVPVENCQEVPQQKCWNEPETKCTEKKMKVAKKWC